MVLDFRFGTERAISKSEEKATLESDASYQAWLQLVSLFNWSGDQGTTTLQCETQ